MSILPPFLGDVGPIKTKPRVSVIPVPYECSTSYAHGTAEGPEAILRASTQVELYDEENDLEVYQLGIETLPPLAFEGLAPEAAMAKIEQAVNSVVASGKFPVVLGGEHSITPAAVRGVASMHPQLTVVQLDAHADLRDSYEGSRYSHASAMARVREQFPVVQVGIRSLSREEADWIKRDTLPVYFAHTLEGEAWISKALNDINTSSVYLTIDVDVFDSSIMPDTGTPEPGGLSWRQVTRFIRSLMQQRKVVGFDTVELMPQPKHHASDFLTARLISKCLGYWQKGL